MPLDGSNVKHQNQSTLLLIHPQIQIYNLLSNHPIEIYLTKTLNEQSHAKLLWASSFGYLKNLLSGGFDLTDLRKTLLYFTSYRMN